MLKRICAVAFVCLTSVALLAGCETGRSRAVDSCSECWADEYCVYGGDGLYCADGCVSDLNCTGDHWCVPLVDEETQDDIDWVCMPEDYYYDYGAVFRSNCGDTGNDCPSGMTCLEDVDYPGDYYCADECDYDDDCLTGCCADSTDGYAYCAPFYPFCG